VSQNGAGPGVWASTGQLAELEESDLVVLVGSDPTEEHPAAAAFIYRARERGARLVAMSMRRHPLARLADVHLPLRPGSEARLIGAILHVLLVEQSAAGEAGEEMSALRASVADLAPELVQRDLGVPAEAIRQAAQLYQAADRITVAYASGLALSPEAASGVEALTSLAAVAASSGSAKVALLDLVARSNLQGCRDMGVAPDVLPGYMNPTDDDAVRRFEGAWNCSLARGPGLTAWQMLDSVEAMYVMGDDPIAHAAAPDGVSEALSRLKFLVVQDVFMGPTAALADVVLPAAAFAERNGTYTNLEARVQRLSPAGDPPGEARADWRIVADVSRAMGAPFPYRDEEQIFGEIADLLPIYAGVMYPPLSVAGGIRWSTSGAVSGASRGVNKLGWRPLNAGDPPEKADDRFPLLLAADPTLRPWDGEVTVCNTLAAAVEFTVIDKDYPEGMLLLNPDDADRLGLRSGQAARVASARGECEMRVRATDEAPGGVALLPYAHATHSGLFEVSVDSNTGRSVLAPTAVSVGPAQ
jgi:predicted molibdopterin-dependent oxidoreductase YjgC